MASTKLTLERGVLWFEDGTEVSNVSVGLLKALPLLLKTVNQFIDEFERGPQWVSEDTHDMAVRAVKAIDKEDV